MSAASLKTLPRATLADLLSLDDEGKGFEIIDGELVQKEASVRHSRAQAKLTSRLDRPFGRRPGGTAPGGWWFLTECLVDFGQREPLRPDVAGWRMERVPQLPDETVMILVPDWICEILSPTNARNDTVKKKRIYYHNKVPHYWLLDPAQEILQVLRWTPDGYVIVLEALRGEKVRAEPFQAEEISVGVFFGDDDE